MNVRVVAPLDHHGDNAEGWLLIVARAAVRAAKSATRPVSQRELEALMNVRAAHSIKRAGIETAIARGALRIEQGDRRKVLHAYVCDLEDTEPCAF